MKQFLLRWFLGWAYLLEGIISIFTLGNVYFGFHVYVAKRLRRERYKYRLTKKK